MTRGRDLNYDDVIPRRPINVPRSAQNYYSWLSMEIDTTVGGFGDDDDHRRRQLQIITRETSRAREREREGEAERKREKAKSKRTEIGK